MQDQRLNPSILHFHSSDPLHPNILHKKEQLWLINYYDKPNIKRKISLKIDDIIWEIFFTSERKNNNKNVFIQDKSLKIESYNDNGLFYSLFNNIPIHWIEFILEFKDEIYQISNDLSLSLNIQNILPKPYEVFRIFHLIKPEQIKVIIIGQDPYPQRGIADGIAFSSHKRPKNTNSTSFMIPNSLMNIYSELKDFEGIEIDINDPSLERWVNQGVFLINSAWTVLENEVNSHGKLWKNYLDHLLRFVKNKNEKCICVSLGEKAKRFISIFPKEQTFHCTHPTSRTADKGFFKSNVFIKINEKIVELYDESSKINWR